MSKQQIWWLSGFLLLLLVTLCFYVVFERNRDIKDQPRVLNKSKQQAVGQVHLYLSKEDRVIQLPLETYLVGVVAAEMPAHFHLEALKAQSLAARTYIVRRKLTGERLDPNVWGPKAEHADVSDTVQHQVYYMDQTLRKMWGKDYAWKIARIRQAVSATQGKVITYQGQPIYAAFFSTSNGWTENSEDYYQTKYPYLRSVPSTWDRASPKYFHQQALTIEQVVLQMEKKTGKRISLEVSKPSTWFRILNKTAGQRVAKIRIGDQVFTGRQVREALQLPSSDFRMEIKADQVLFRTRGYGHGVGMSQWGANLMAHRGSKMEEIIAHYYRNVRIVKWQNDSS